MSQIVDTNFVVIKYFGLPEVFNQFCYKCIHRSCIVIRDGRNVFVACPLLDVKPLCTHHMDVSEVYSAVVEYETGQKCVTLKCVPSQWLNSPLAKNVFIRDSPLNENQEVMQLVIDNSSALGHWKPYMATLYYQTNDLEDAMLYASLYISPHREPQSAFSSTSTNIQNTIVDDSFFGTLEATRRLTLTEQFNIIRPLVASVLCSAYLFRDNNSGPFKAFERNEHYKYLHARAVTYAKFLQTKIMHYINLYGTNAIDLGTATKAINDEMKKAIIQLLSIINDTSE